MRRLARLWLLLPAIFALSMTGCSPYIDNYHFQPRPALTNITPATQNALPPVSSMATIVGIRRKDKDHNLPESVEVRLRIDNNSPNPIVFDPTSLQLSNGMFLKFQSPLLDPPTLGVLTVPPKQSALAGAFFPFPPGQSHKNTDLSMLQLNWEIGYQGRSVPHSVAFTRIIPIYYYPYQPYYPYYHPFYYRGYYH